MNKVIDYNHNDTLDLNNKEVYLDIKMESTPYQVKKIKDNNLKYKVAKNINVNAVKNSIYNIFTWIPGERVLNPEFGNKLKLYLYEGITDFNIEKIVTEIKHCVLEWEPRAQIDEVVNITNIDDVENSVVHLQIRYSIPNLTEEQFYYDYIIDKKQ